ncbi:hypothetical protein [Geomesophilobacter sediminis]|uniref:Carbohydrate-binding protein n=1 Tax=Geomesophilobacter sediminis TaxID=2798584 RepID=A0A8J7J717_9BACT|nr:hypothetical protein [Geomesophilobacter sediminis]MBJ6724796.1 hypothetical protein [Geomesophilobacter sediminis]
MRKRIVGNKVRRSHVHQGEWLDLEDLAKVEVSTEDPEHPIEQALVEGGEGGWRATEPGEQYISVLFDHPRTIRNIRVFFRETEVDRTQEFVIRWSSDGVVFREALRQQFNFSPPATTEEIEEYRVEMRDVSCVELIIIPDQQRRHLASLEQLRLA